MQSITIYTVIPNSLEKITPKFGSTYSSTTGANLDIFLSFKPYFMNMNGTGKAKQEMPPNRLDAGPTPMFRNIGLAAKGSPHASKERRNVFAEIALAA